MEVSFNTLTVVFVAVGSVDCIFASVAPALPIFVADFAHFAQKSRPAVFITQWKVFCAFFSDIPDSTSLFTIVHSASCNFFVTPLSSFAPDTTPLIKLATGIDINAPRPISVAPTAHSSNLVPISSSELIAVAIFSVPDDTESRTFPTHIFFPDDSITSQVVSMIEPNIDAPPDASFIVCAVGWNIFWLRDEAHFDIAPSSHSTIVSLASWYRLFFSASVIYQAL